MTTRQIPISENVESLLAPPSSEPAKMSAFHVHGVWTAGVLLMRAIRFRSKAMIICALFLIPLTMLARSYFARAGEDIGFSRKELHGVEYNRALFPLLDLAQQLRRDSSIRAASGVAPVTMAKVQQDINARYRDLENVQKALGAELDTASAFTAVHAAFDRLETLPAGADIFAAHTVHTQALVKLIQAVTDNSNLTLDPEIATYYIMDAAMSRLPEAIESTAQLRGRGGEYLRTGAITSGQQRELIETISSAVTQMAAIKEGLAKIKDDPDFLTRINLNGPLNESATFFKSADKNVIDGLSAQPDMPKTYREVANTAISHQYQLADRLTDELDKLLTIRVNNLVRDRNLTVVVTVVTLLAAAYFFYTFYLVTSGGLILISKHLQEMAAGDLRRAPALPWGKDEPAAVIADLRIAYESLHRLVRAVGHSARSLHATSGEIAGASVDLSARTETAAASLEEQAASMEEIGSTVGNNADRAGTAAKFAAQNSQLAIDGGNVIATVIETMQAIHASSDKISDINSVIDGIAFQTNILALNAAVEAARAGEAGRGFAVVATEVRTLAHRSASAAAEIKALITNSVAQIESGTKIVEVAGSTMTSVVENARKMSGFLDDISTASREQAQGVSQVGSAIHDLDSHTQQNSALVEQTSAACASLKQQAEDLQLEIAKFRIA